MNSFHHKSSVVPLLLSSVLSSTISAIEFDKMQPFQRASQPASQPAGSLASPHILPLKLLFSQPSMQAAQTQMEADAMDDWFSGQAEEGEIK